VGWDYGTPLVASRNVIDAGEASDWLDGFAACGKYSHVPAACAAAPSFGQILSPSAQLHLHPHPHPPSTLNHPESIARLPLRAPDGDPIILQEELDQYQEIW
jgi:hypothetical protein